MLICGLDRVTAERLIQMGLTGFAEMASWTAVDVDRLRDRLGLDRRISTGCWIEQAAILARGGETSYSGRVRRGESAALVRQPTPQASGLLRPLPQLAVRLPHAAAQVATAPASALGRPQRGSLMRRLGVPQPAAADMPRGLPASFTGVVEEAVVEIVRGQRRDQGPAGL